MGTYDEQDLKRIIKRAAELQQRASGPDSVSGGSSELSLDEIQEIAREMGVSPDFVREAALEYEGIPVEEPMFLDTGDKYKKELIGFVKGEMDKKTWAEMRSIIEYHFDAPGKVNRRPRGIKWKAEPRGISKWLATRKSPEVEVKSEGNQTSIRIRKSLKSYQKLTWPAWFFLGVAFMLFTIMLVEQPGGDDIIGILMGMAASLGAAQLFRKWAKRKVRKAGQHLKEAMEQLQTIVARKQKAGGRSAPEWTKSLEEKRKREQASGGGKEQSSPERPDRSGKESTGPIRGLRNALKEKPGEEDKEDDSGRQREKSRN